MRLMSDIGKVDVCVGGDVLYPALQQSNFSYENGVLEWDLPEVKIVLPGSGEPDPMCGKVKFAVNCENHDRCDRKPTFYYYNCMNILCPVCKEIVCKREASKITERITEMGKIYKNRVGLRLGKLKHIILSPPQDVWDEDFVKENREKIRGYAVEILKKYAKDGFYGGVLIFHSHRRKHRDGSSCENPDCKKAHIWVFSPHFHYVGYVFLEKSDVIYSETGWVIKNVEKIKGRGKKRNLYGTVFYLLTHRAVFVRKERVWDSLQGIYVEGMYKWRSVGQGYSYVGIFANCKGGKCILEKRKEIGVCEKCGGNLCEYLAYEEDGEERVEYSQMLGYHLIDVIVYCYYVNVKLGSLKVRIRGDVCEWEEGQSGEG